MLAPGRASRAKRRFPGRWYGGLTWEPARRNRRLRPTGRKAGGLNVSPHFLPIRHWKKGAFGMAWGGCISNVPEGVNLLTLGGRSVDVHLLLRAALDHFGRPSIVAADRWREAELRDALEKAGIPPAAFEARGMGYMDGGADVRAFRRACADGKVTPTPSLLLRSAMSEARTVSDPAGNAKLSKGSQGGRPLAGDAMTRRRRRSWPWRRA